MEILDQSEVDALLSAGASAAEPIGAGAPSARGGGRLAQIKLPPGFELLADRSQLERIEPVRVPVVVRLAQREMPIEQILNVTVGTIIEFERAADSELDLVVNNVVIGTGNAVKCGEKFGLRIIQIEPWAKRLVANGLYR